MSKSERTIGLVVFGFGGHARSLADVALQAGILELVFVDANARPGESLDRFPVQRSFDSALPDGWKVIPASGCSDIRQLQLVMAREKGWPIATLIAPTATIGMGSQLGFGTFVGQHAHIGPFSTIGEGCIINTGAVVEHESRIGAYTHISVNSTVAGRSSVGTHCFIGAGAVVIDSVDVGDRTTLGAGACALWSLIEAGTYVGTPARRIKENTQK